MPPQGGSSSGPVPGGSGFPALGLFPKAVEERFLVLERTDDGQTLEKVSPFLIDKSIRNCCGDVSSIKRIRDGKILIKVNNDKQASKIRNLKYLVPGINIVASDHATLNSCRVVITCRDLLEMKDEEILEEMREEKVIKVERIMRKIDGVLTKTPSLILTISSPYRPEKIKVGFMLLPTRPHYPRPMRCFQCLKYGHLGRDCKADKTCANCGDLFHGEDCTREAKCINCQKSHKAVSPDCDVWKKETEIIRLRIDQNISYLDAKRIFEQRNSSRESYASKTAFGNNRIIPLCNSPKIIETQSVETQTDECSFKNAKLTDNVDDEETPTNTARSHTSTSEESRPPSPKQKRVKTAVKTSIDKNAEEMPNRGKNTITSMKRKPGRPRKKPLPLATQDTTEPEEISSDMDIL